MGKIKAFFTDIHDRLIKQSERTDLDYRLSSSTKLPRLEELKMAHSKLLQGYVNSLVGIGKLSFFVNSYEFSKSSKQPSIARFFLYLLHKLPPLNVQIVRPLVSALAEEHIKAKLKELESIYIQTKSAIPFYQINSSEYLNWLNSAIMECQEFSKTLSLADNIKKLFPSAISLLSITGIATIIAKSLLVPYNMALFFIFLIFVSIFAFGFVDSSFSAKREIFQGLDGESNIYLQENLLFQLLERSKNIEWPIDYLGTGLFFFPILIFLKLTFHIDSVFVYLLLTIIYIGLVWLYARKRIKSHLV